MSTKEGCCGDWGRRIDAVERNIGVAVGICRVDCHHGVARGRARARARYADSFPRNSLVRAINYRSVHTRFLFLLPMAAKTQGFTLAGASLAVVLEAI